MSGRRADDDLGLLLNWRCQNRMLTLVIADLAPVLTCHAPRLKRTKTGPRPADRTTAANSCFGMRCSSACWPAGSRAPHGFA